MHASAVRGHFGQRICWCRIKSIILLGKNKKSYDILYAVMWCLPGEQVRTCPLSKIVATHSCAKTSLVIYTYIYGFCWQIAQVLGIWHNFGSTWSTEFGHLIVLTHPFTARQVAQLFLDNIYKIHRLPEAILIDRDKVFTSHF